MSTDGQEPTTDNTEPTEETQDGTEGQAPEEGSTPAASVNDLPEWAQTEIKKLRSENAERRKAAKQAEKEAEKLAQKQAEEQGKFKELYEAEQAKRLEAEQAASDAQLARLREKVGRELNIPAALVDRLQGETEDELKADAESILASLPKPAPAGGADGPGGTNQKAPTPAMTEAELREYAARLNVNPEHLRQSLRSQGMEIST